MSWSRLQTYDSVVKVVSNRWTGLWTDIWGICYTARVRRQIRLRYVTDVGSHQSGCGVGPSPGSTKFAQRAWARSSVLKPRLCIGYCHCISLASNHSVLYVLGIMHPYRRVSLVRKRIKCHQSSPPVQSSDCRRPTFTLLKENESS